MKVSYNWLKEFVPIELDPAALADRLTLAGVEVDRVERIRPSFTGVVTGLIVSLDPAAGKPGWTWCRVDIGAREVTTLCAAPNVSPGLLTAVALPGGVLAGGVGIEQRKIGGRVSEAVLCSEKELDLGENDRGIMELPPGLQAGLPLEKALELADVILDIDVTPNRPDLLSVRGVARDIAALTGQKMSERETVLPETAPPIGKETSVTVRDFSLCPRYCARLIRGVRITESPFPIRRRLSLCGIKPVNNVVDATNYALLELGHPLHAFDLQRLAGQKIIVRAAAAGESIVTIDGDERQLHPSMLVIADAEKPVAVAGVMGGLFSEIGDATTAILLESAYFAPVGIRRTSRMLGISTEASRRFERGADPRAAPLALDRTAGLILDLAGGSVAEGRIDEKRDDFPPGTVALRPSRTNHLLGWAPAPEAITESLSRLGLKREKQEEDRLTFSVPTWRPDLTREVDLIEEVARIAGFDRIPAVMPVSRITYRKRSPGQIVADRIREILCGLGLDEVITYSFMAPKSLDRLLLPAEDPLRRACRISNPVNKEQGLLRTTLIPGLLETVERNLNQKLTQVRIFELGKVFSSEEPAPPGERTLLSLALWRRPDKPDWCRPEPALDFYTLKGMLELLGERMGTAEMISVPAAHPVFQAGQSARLLIGKTVAGVAGTVAAAVLDSYSIPSPVFLAELEMRPFLEAPAGVPRFRSPDQYPAVRRDMALVIDESVPYQSVKEAIEAHRPELLEEYALFDLYSGDPIPEGKKSFAFSLKYRSSYDTLCETKVNKVHAGFQELLIQALGCSFR
ncbi:MAG: phenylalanine--tRNA ligase subunit beta [PVC group bacterium]